jgi:ArsR family transcriptional regulator, arsenate/arsenite/antimonite-responsive transcriptional repressor
VQELTNYFKGLADPNRLRILNLLLHGELCGCDIQYVMDTSQPNVSRHLIYLKNCGLVTDRRVGYRVFYSLAEHKQGTLAALFGFLGKAFKHQEELRKDTQKLKRAIEAGSCTVNEWHPYSAVAKAKSAQDHPRV